MESSRDQSRESWNGKSKRRMSKRKKKKRGKKRKRKRKRKKKRPKKERKREVQKVAEKCEIWKEKVVVAKSEVKAKKLVLKRLHKWIQVFGRKASERMPIKKLWDHAIDMREGFMPRKRKVYPLSREEIHEFITEQLRKEYIRSSKSPQIASVFFVGKKDGKKRMV